MKTSTLKSAEWWLDLAADIIDLSPGSVVKNLVKLLGDDDPEVKKKICDHYNRNIKEVDEYSLRINDKLILGKIYVSPRVSREKISQKEEKTPKCEIESLIPDLVKELESNNRPIVVHGQPGHGKTSSMRVLARALAANAQKKRKDRPLVLFYEFKDLHDLNRNEFEILQQMTSFVKGETFFEKRDTVIILDGMDERMASGDDRGLKSFLRHMLDLYKRVNSLQNSSLKLIMTGRTKFVNDIKGEFPEEYIQYEINDFTDDNLDSWLTKFNSITGESLSSTELNERHLSTLKYQPVLLTICSTILTSADGKELFNKKGNYKFNRIQVYEKIIKWTYNKKSHAEKWPEEQYGSFLQAIAFVLFSKSQGSITTMQIRSELEKIKRLFEPAPFCGNNANIDDELKRLSICFFFDGHEVNSFSFIHKSIQDYLVAIAIMHGIENITDSFNERRSESSCSSMAEELYLLLSQQPISAEDHQEFMLQYLENKQDFCKQTITALTHFLAGAIEHRYLFKNAVVASENPLRAEAVLIANLTFLNVLCIRVLDNAGFDFEDLKTEHSKIWDSDVINRINHLLCSYSCKLNLPFLTKESIDVLSADYFFSYIVFYKAKFKGANLADTNFRDADFSGADLRGANLWGAELCGAKLRGTDLMSADLRNANLADTNFRDANLVGANLTNAWLMGADLTDAWLMDANLTGANLINIWIMGADLRRANLMGADLSDAILGYADLSEANLRGADLRGTDLSDANFSGTELTDAHLSGAKYNSKTEFPKGFDKEAHGMEWVDDSESDDGTVRG
jgi:uncharacterized protein YjbI with pentapeptide repeats